MTPRILIADDDVGSLSLLKRVLQFDYDVTAVTSGEAALEALARDKFDLVILDIMMRRTSGLVVLMHIRKMPEDADLPVILVSGMAKSEDIVHGLEVGANDYITKPFDVAIVRARVARQIIIKQALDERKAVIAYLKNAQEMKDHFLRIATHDLKNPLNSIRLAQYFLRDLVGNDPQAMDALDAIEDSVDWMSTLVEDFLDTSLLKTGGAGLKLEPVTAAEVIWEVIEQHTTSANRKDITLLVGKDEGILQADNHRLVQIIGNLVSNAIKYSPAQRFVTVSSEIIGERVRFNIADEGPGIPPEERKNLFKAFSKLSNKPTAGETSSGLGLWIVKELVDLHNGEVGVECPPDGGSIFWVELPVNNPAAKAASD